MKFYALLYSKNHGKCCPALSRRSQISRITEHGAKWHFGFNFAYWTFGINGLNLAFAGVDITDDVSNKFTRRNNINQHNRLQHNRISFTTTTEQPSLLLFFTPAPTLPAWVAEVAALTTPDRISWVTGSAQA